MPQPKKRSLSGTKNAALASHVKAARVRSAAAAGASSSAEPIAEMGVDDAAMAMCVLAGWVAGAGGGGAVAGGVGVADVTERNAGARQLPRQEVELRELLSRCSQAAGHTAFQHELESIQSSKKSKADKARSVEALRIRMKRFLDDAGAGGASWPRAEEERPAEAGRPPPVRFDDGTGTDERGVGRRARQSGVSE